MIQCCLNGVRTAVEETSVPVTPADLAAAARAAQQAGADCVHLHPKGPGGDDSLDRYVVAATLEAVRDVCPGLPVGVTTGAWIRPDPVARLREIETWQVLPDFASVNWHETGAADVADHLVERGVGVEAGLWFPEAVRDWGAHPSRDRHLRVLVELPDGLGAESTRSAAAELVALVGEVGDPAVLLHGEGSSAWPALRYALEHDLHARIGLEDTLVLPDGSPVAGNEDLVRAAYSFLPA